MYCKRYNQIKTKEINFMITKFQSGDKRLGFQGQLKLNKTIVKRLQNDSQKNLERVYSELNRINKVNDGKIYKYFEEEKEIDLLGLYAFETRGAIIDDSSNVLASRRIKYVEELQQDEVAAPSFISDLICEFTNRVYPPKTSANDKASVIQKIIDILA